MFENPVFLEPGTFPQSLVRIAAWPGLTAGTLTTRGTTDCGPDPGARDSVVGWKDP